MFILILMTILIGYLFGCLHGSQIIGKLKQINLKNNGSKNAGATNTVLLLGWKYGFIVAFVDVFKAIISFLLVALMLHKYNVLFEVQILLLYLNALFVIIGHNFPLTMNFKGGKGTASFLGFLLCLDWKFTIFAFMLFIMFALITKYFVFGTLIAYVSFTFYTASSFGRGALLIAVLFTILFLVQHVENFRRVINKEEMKISTMFRREAS